jgi:hypothetical protein
MKSALFAVIAGAVLVADTDHQCRAQLQQNVDQRERLIRDIVEAKTSDELGKAYRSLFRLVGRHGLADLLRDPNTGIALQAAWEIASERPPKDPRANIQRFIGFVRGRTQMQVPLLWEVGLICHSLFFSHPSQRDATLKEYVHIAAFLKIVDGSVRQGPLPYKVSPLGISLPAGMSAKKEKDKIVISRGQASILVRADLFEDLRSRRWFKFDYCSVLIGPKYAYLILHDQFGSRFPLVKLDTQSGKKCWQASVMAFGTENLGPLTGSWDHYPELVSTDDNIAIFGLGAGGCYLEAFDQQTGKNCYRFATNLWYVPK